MEISGKSSTDPSGPGGRDSSMVGPRWLPEVLRRTVSGGRLASSASLVLGTFLCVLLGHTALNVLSARTAKERAEVVHERAHATEEESATYALKAKDMQLAVVEVQQWLTDVAASQTAENPGFAHAEEQPKLSAACARFFAPGTRRPAIRR
ncbi:MAG: hypothetical protein V2A77_08620 [Pseudomonadota bacterium]